MLEAVYQGLDIMIVTLGQHLIVVRESQHSHYVICKIREPSRHVLVFSMESGRIANLLTEELQLRKDSLFI